MIWSEKHNISEYLEAPKKAGVYMLGIPNGLHKKSGEKEDDFLGKNFPEDFGPMYVGVSKRSIRSRLYSHYKGLGNKNAEAFIKHYSSDKLFFIFYESLETEIEDVFLFALVDGFPWSVKRREQGNFHKLLIQLLEKN